MRYFDTNCLLLVISLFLLLVGFFSLSKEANFKVQCDFNVLYKWYKSIRLRICVFNRIDGLLNRIDGLSSQSPITQGLL